MFHPVGTLYPIENHTFPPLTSCAKAAHDSIIHIMLLTAYQYVNPNIIESV
jgi:hypothetical protein